jgi:hypothetical protein
MSDLNLLVAEYLEDNDALTYLTIEDKNVLKKYKLKQYIKWSEVKKNPPISIVENLIYDSALPIKKLPDTIINIRFSDTFDCDLENLSPKLQVLETGKIFNSVINNDNLPKTLISLTLNEEYTKEIKELPPKLKYLKLHDWNPQIINVTSENLETLCVKNVTSCHCCRFMPTSIPRQIKYLRVTGSIEKTLYFNEGLISLTLSHKCFDNFAILPKTLKSLRLINFNKSLEGLHSVNRLVLDDYNKELKYLPSTLTYLHLGNKYDQELELPEGLQTLIIGNSFTKSVNQLPKTLTSLSLGNLYNKSLDQLPESLIELSIGDSFNHSLTMLPKLKKLTLGSAFQKWINRFPKTLESLEFASHKNKTFINQVYEEVSTEIYSGSEISKLHEFSHLSNLTLLKIDVGTKIHSIIFGDPEGIAYKSLDLMGKILESASNSLNPEDQNKFKSIVELGMQFGKFMGNTK